MLVSWFRDFEDDQACYGLRQNRLGLLEGEARKGGRAGIGEDKLEIDKRARPDNWRGSYERMRIDEI